MKVDSGLRVRLRKGVFTNIIYLNVGTGIGEKSLCQPFCSCNYKDFPAAQIWHFQNYLSLDNLFNFKCNPKSSWDYIYCLYAQASIQHKMVSTQIQIHTFKVLSLNYLPFMLILCFFSFLFQGHLGLHNALHRHQMSSHASRSSEFHLSKYLKSLQAHTVSFAARRSLLSLCQVPEKLDTASGIYTKLKF